MQRFGAWFRRPAWRNRVDVLMCGLLWVLALISAVDAVLWNSIVTADRWVPGATIAGLALLSTWHVAGMRHDPAEAQFKTTRENQRKINLFVIFETILSTVFGGLTGWIVFEMTSGLPLEARGQWAVISAVTVLGLGFAIPTGGLLFNAWRYQRRSNQITAEMRARGSEWTKRKDDE